MCWRIERSTTRKGWIIPDDCYPGGGFIFARCFSGPATAFGLYREVCDDRCTLKPARWRPGLGADRTGYPLRIGDDDNHDARGNRSALDAGEDAPSGSALWSGPIGLLLTSVSADALGGPVMAYLENVIRTHQPRTMSRR